MYSSCALTKIVIVVFLWIIFSSKVGSRYLRLSDTNTSGNRFPSFPPLIICLTQVIPLCASVRTSRSAAIEANPLHLIYIPIHINRLSQATRESRKSRRETDSEWFHLHILHAFTLSGFAYSFLVAPCFRAFRKAFLNQYDLSYSLFLTFDKVFTISKSVRDFLPSNITHDFRKVIINRVTFLLLRSVGFVQRESWMYTFDLESRAFYDEVDECLTSRLCSRLKIRKLQDLSNEAVLWW